MVEAKSAEASKRSGPRRGSVERRSRKIEKTQRQGVRYSSEKAYLSLDEPIVDPFPLRSKRNITRPERVDLVTLVVITWRMDGTTARAPNQWFSGGFHRNLVGPAQLPVSCWGRFVRQSSCPSSFAEVGFELVPVASPGVTLVCLVEDPELWVFRAGVEDGIRALIGDPAGSFGGIEIRWVHGIEHPVDSHRRAFQVATETALRHALGEPQEIRGALGGIGFTSRKASHG